MSIINLCLEFQTEISNFTDTSDYKSVYESYYKPIVSFLYAHPEFQFSFYFSGPEFDFIKQKNPEFIEIIKKLVNRKQVEILGGGYYTPVFPLLFPLDRTGQVELLSSSVRKSVGKRPRGIVLCASAWDPSLVTSFETCGMEYVQLDSSLIQKEKNLFLPIVMADRGKSIKILSVQSDFIPAKDEEPEQFIQRIKKTIDKVAKTDTENEKAERVAVIMLNRSNAKKFFDEKWANEFLNLIKTKYSNNIKLSLPVNCARNSCAYVQSYIHAGISSDIAHWAYEPYKKSEVKDTSAVNIYDFMQTYKRSQALYNRMIFVSLLVNQCHGDKMRKKTAREYLWAAQTGDAYVCKSSGILVSSQERQNAYRKLTDAEKLVRECESFNESISSFDYNCDGFKEYVCRMDKFNACITLRGGSIFELDVIKKSGNYADNMSRCIPLDKCNDNYEKGLFIDHLFEPEEYENYIKGRACKNGVFSGNIYHETGFAPQKHEIKLETDSYFPSLDQTVLLKKKFIVSSSGIMVQYIIKNTSPIALKAKFVVESNFAQTCFKEDSFDSYKIEVVNNGQIEEKTPKNLEFMKNVDAFQLYDTDNNISFTFEPNEMANLVSYPIVFMRKKTDSSDLEPAGRTLSLSLAWDVDLACGMEMEKTINLTIISNKRKK
ncbi:alpha-amylase/4-alpha-glucanotransferase domain-containing protein [Treponema sp.]|uniref:alpha-amylase/4-alpha-glucanotransferase domain-containing protein n=1 Tax=Treponema sp. TaxID=166 RepID=UPI00298DE420|nr:alpha-amylase/4-alpha-glucanotransferase domain-containing protein [Treponema sp.]MCR5613280.1 DUF1926 domain-containing protein [Treponema sp.]